MNETHQNISIQMKLKGIGKKIKEVRRRKPTSRNLASCSRRFISASNLCFPTASRADKERIRWGIGTAASAMSNRREKWKRAMESGFSFFFVVVVVCQREVKRGKKKEWILFKKVCMLFSHDSLICMCVCLCLTSIGHSPNYCLPHPRLYSFPPSSTSHYCLPLFIHYFCIHPTNGALPSIATYN